jgi:hypothetical protein
MKQLQKLKIKSIKKLDTTEKVYDISVENFNHYIDDNGIVHHNSGLYYSSSVVAFMTKAKLKEEDVMDDMDLGQSGITVSFKTEKNRLAKPKKVKFDISFVKGSNPYKGLEAFCRPEYFDTIGIGMGKWEPYPKPKEILDKNTGEITLKEGEFKAGGNRWYCKHIGEYITKNELHTPRVFTQDVLEAMEPIINNYFKYKSLDEINEYQKEFEEIEEEDLGDDMKSLDDLFE